MKMLKIFYFRISVVFQFGHAMELYIEETWHNSLIHKDIICPPKTMTMTCQYLGLLCSLNQEWYISSTHPVRSCVFGSSNYCELFVNLVGFYIKTRSGNPSNEDLIWVKIEYVHEQPILVYKAFWETCLILQKALDDTSWSLNWCCGGEDLASARLHDLRAYAIQSSCLASSPSHPKSTGRSF